MCINKHRLARRQTLDKPSMRNRFKTMVDTYHRDWPTLGKAGWISDQNIILDLLLLLSDAAEHDEGMFSIIHAADDEEYIRALLAAFVDMMRSAPQWTFIVLMRALNSRSTQLELVKQLRGAPLKTKQSVDEMCEWINEISLEFLSTTVPVTLAARTWANYQWCNAKVYPHVTK